MTEMGHNIFRRDMFKKIVKKNDNLLLLQLLYSREALLKFQAQMASKSSFSFDCKSHML